MYFIVLNFYICNFRRSPILFQDQKSRFHTGLRLSYSASLDPTKNYFEILDHEVNFVVDAKQLSKKHRHLQTQFHPDKFSNKSKEEQDHSENMSALINEAYSTLTNPMKRALYLLELNGDPLLEGDQPVLDEEFLVEILELNEEIDDADCEADIEALKVVAEEKISELHEKLKMCFDEKRIPDAKMIVAKMQYFHNVKDQLKYKDY